MTPTYIIYARRSGIIVTDHNEFGRQVWEKRKARKPHKCVICGGDVGGEGYRPVTNLGNRMDRICAKH